MSRKYPENSAIFRVIDNQQKRILIPKKVIETLDFEKEVFAVGHEDRLDIYKDEATYLKLKNDH